MTAPPMSGGGPVMPGAMVPEDPSAVTQALLRAARVAAENAAAVESGAEAKDFGQAALNFAQAVVVLDPSLSQGGTPVAHDIALEQIRGQTQQNVAQIQGDHAVAVENVRGAHALRAAKETAAAPTPAKRKTVSVQRDEHNRMSSATVSEG